MNKVTREAVVAKEVGSIQLDKIDCFGSHLGVSAGVRGRVSSVLHWSGEYDRRNLGQYYVQWAQEAEVDEGVEIPEGFESFFGGLKLLKGENGGDFGKAHSRHVARIVDEFVGSEERLKAVFSAYRKVLGKGDAGRFDIDGFIEAAKVVLAKGKEKEEVGFSLKDAIKAGMAEAESEGEILGVYDGIVWDIACTFWGYRYEALTIGVSGSSMLFPGFWGFLASGFLAEVTVPTVGAWLRGVYNSGTVEGGMKEVMEGWERKVGDDGSFHPLVDSLLGSLWIACSWLYIEKLNAAVKVGNALFKLNFILKYSTMNFYFALKGELQKERFTSENVTKAALKGVIRGFIKNPLAEASTYAQGVFKLSQGLSLAGYAVPGGVLEFLDGVCSGDYD